MVYKIVDNEKYFENNGLWFDDNFEYALYQSEKKYRRYLVNPESLKMVRNELAISANYSFP